MVQVPGALAIAPGNVHDDHSVLGAAHSRSRIEEVGRNPP